MIARTPRIDGEDFHHKINVGLSSHPKIKNRTLFIAGEHVGRSIDGLDSNGNLSNKEDPFGSYQQAINSSNMLVDLAVQELGQGRSFLIFPVCVIPDDKLWVVDFDHHGNLVGAKQENYTTCFLDIEVNGLNNGAIRFRHSHIFFCTLKGVVEIASYFKNLSGNNLTDWITANQ